MELMKKEFIFHTDNNLFQVCHASTVCALGKNRILVAWFAGSIEGSNDTAIWISRSTEGEWSEPIKIEDESCEPHWNPVLYKHSDGTVYLFYKVGAKISEWRTRIRYSTDGGLNWSKSRDLVPGDFGGRGPVRNKVVRLSNGMIIAGGSIEQGIWYAFSDRSTEDLKKWEKSNEIKIEGITYDGEKTVENSDIEVSEQSFYGRGIIQPTLWESLPGHVHMLLRSTEGNIYRSDSLDYGKTWSKPYSTILPNNNSGIDVVNTANGELFLCYNPVGDSWGVRTPLKIAHSKDNGNTWNDIYTLESGEGEYSYPAIIEDENHLYVSYTWNRKTIVVAKFHL